MADVKPTTQVAAKPNVQVTAAPKATGNADPTKAATVAVKSPPPFKIDPVKTAGKWFKGMFYGVPGSGKTTLLGSAVDVPAMRDVFVLDCESGLMSVTETDQIENAHLIDVVKVVNFEMMAKIHLYLKTHCQYRDANNVDALKKLQARMMTYPDGSPIDWKDIVDLGNETTLDGLDIGVLRLRRYRTCGIDSLSEVDAYSMYDLLKINEETKFDDDIDTADWGHYKKNNLKMQLVVRAFRDLPMHILLNCAIAYTQDELKKFHWAPRLTGQLSQQTQGFVDLVGYLKAGKPDEKGVINRQLAIQPIGSFDAKNRIASYTKAYFSMPTMAKIMSAFSGINHPDVAKKVVKQAEAETVDVEQLISGDEVVEAAANEAKKAEAAGANTVNLSDAE